MKRVLSVLARECGPVECVLLGGMGLVFYGLATIWSVAAACLGVGVILLVLAWPRPGAQS